MRRNIIKAPLSFKKSLIIKLLEKKFIGKISFFKKNLAKKMKTKTKLTNILLRLIKSFLFVQTEHINKTTTITPPKKTNTIK